MKRKVTGITVAVCLIAIVATVAFAATGPFYGRTRNYITTGSISIDIKEYGANDTVFSDITDALPGVTYDKKVTVKNSGGQEAWVRAKVEITSDNADTVLGNDRLENIAKIKNGAADGFNTADWTYNDSDGWWYYKTALAAADETNPLFTAVGFPDTIGNSQQGAVLTVKVTVQAVQKANNGDTYDAAVGWPLQQP